MEPLFAPGNPPHTLCRLAQTRRAVLSHWAVCFLVMLCAMAWAVEPARLAVLNSGQPEWGDLLMVRLSKSPAVALVERDDIGKALDEVSLKDVVSDRTKRSRFGEIAGADFLAMLSVDGKIARLVVCDTRLGVTLQDQSIGMADQPQEKVLGVLADTALQTIQSFAGGVKQVVAVPNFICRDLTFDFTHLQSDYAEVLRSAYRQIPGLTVVAIEEAKAIAVERDIAGLEPKDRIVSVFIEGEYRTTRDLKNGGASVEITLRARDSAKVLLERKLPSVPTGQAGRELMAVFTRDLAELTQTGETKIDEPAQYRMLVGRAEEFSLIGDFLRSTELREAALLLKPEDDEQRIRLTREYISYNFRPYEPSAWPKGAKADASNPLWVAASEQAISNWIRSLQHCEYLVLNRRISREEATDLGAAAIRSITGAGGHGPLNECETLRKDFMRHVFSRVAYLDPASKESFDIMRKRGCGGAHDVYFFIFDSALFRCDGKRHQADDLELLADLLIGRLPDSMWPCYNLLHSIESFGAQVAGGRNPPDCFTIAQYQEFLDLLLASNRPVVNIYGRYGKLRLRWTKGEKSTALLEEANDLAGKAASLGLDRAIDDYFLNILRDFARWIGDELKKETTHTVPAPPRIARTPAPPPNARLSLEGIDLRLSNANLKGKLLDKQMKWRSPSGWSGLDKYRPLATGLDAMWGHGAVFFMTQPGELTQVLADEKLSVADVVFDGRYVWVASYCGWGLSVLDREGRELARMGQENGLPPCEDYSGLVIHPIESGRVLVAGYFGKQVRGWIAIVSFENGTGKVKVIHEGIKSYKDSDDYYSEDTTHAFAPFGVIEHVIPGPKARRVFFIPRGRPVQPLMVDPESLQVRVYPANPVNKKWFPGGDPHFDKTSSFLSIDGVLWVAGTSNDFLSFRFNEQTNLLDGVPERDRWFPYQGYASGSLARAGDWLYSVGYKWRRLNLSTGVEETLLEDAGQLPHVGSGAKWSIHSSSHYGLIANCEGVLYRVKITPGFLKP